MAIEPRLIVTGREPDGTSVFVADQSGVPVTVDAIPGSEFYLLWGTEDGKATVGTKSRQPKLFPFFPGTGGTRILFLRWAPESFAPEQVGDPAELTAEANDELPGLMEVFEPDNPGMHTTDTIDYGICLEGELHLELDNGKEVKLTPGTCVVQQGTRHAWHNRGDKPALMCYVLVGADRDS
ncbi:cupin domain-containing protein [Actinomadura sp. HBU206391]|uniref:cupin domain-containing protein n=1 Tax=Actinomadura sp. HBU206391 TaxID=2731692 RepID=UPI001650A4E7|nr:cupin domain-containing protein [Actinomadura sp. HBU206391]MBC6463281.1 cupin domain-containing protein [Actinomadura sp. HBU206391]